MENKTHKILILGATGMAGHMVYTYLENTKNYSMFNTVFRTKLNADSIVCDVRNAEQISTVIESVKPDFVINCVGALIKESKSNPENTVLLNSWLPYFLSNLAKIKKYKLIHISTDCVFSGNKGGYKVDDFRDADDFYGRTKALGELINERDLTIRTSIIGPELKENGEGLMHWFLTQKTSVNGYTNAYWSGITTLELAKVIEQGIEHFNPGIYNVSPEKKISKYDLLVLINKIFKKQLEIMPAVSKSVDKSLIGSSLLNNYSISNYDKMLLDLYNYMNQLKFKEYLKYL